MHYPVMTERQLAEYAVQLLQVIERGAGAGQHVATVAAEHALVQLEIFAGARHKLPHARCCGTRLRLWVEGNFDERQQSQFGGQAAALHFFDDVEQVATAAFGHPLYIGRVAGVPRLPFLDKLGIQVGQDKTFTQTLPELGALNVLHWVQADAQQRRS